MTDHGGLSEAVNFGFSTPKRSSKETGKVQIDKIHPFAMEKRKWPRRRRHDHPRGHAALVSLAGEIEIHVPPLADLFRPVCIAFCLLHGFLISSISKA